MQLIVLNCKWRVSIGVDQIFKSLHCLRNAALRGVNKLYNVLKDDCQSFTLVISILSIFIDSQSSSEKVQYSQGRRNKVTSECKLGKLLHSFHEINIFQKYRCKKFLNMFVITHQLADHNKKIGKQLRMSINQWLNNPLGLIPLTKLPRLPIHTVSHTPPHWSLRVEIRMRQLEYLPLN